MAVSRQSSNRASNPALNAEAGAGTILIVEDEVSVRTLVTRYLALNGFRVVSAEDARSALSAWAEHKGGFDLLLTDVIMPGAMSGRALAARFQAERPSLKVLFTSGYSAESLNADGSLDAEINFLQKPYRPEQLLETVRAVLAGQFKPHAELLC